MQADIDHIRNEMKIKNFHFPILEVAGNMAKEDRIRRLIPMFESGNIFIPSVMTFRDSEGSWRDMVKEFVEEEFTVFPVSKHDDMLDALSRIIDAPITEPSTTLRTSGYTSIEGLPQRLEYNIFGGTDNGYDIFQ